jgi:transcriptional regulator with XRE-family HTH domain
MNLKRLLMKKGMTQIELAKELGANYSQVSRQINLHFKLPDKYLEKFCAILEISKDDLEKAMMNGGSNE